MQPRDLWSPPVPEQYVVSDVDKLIAEENARMRGEMPATQTIPTASTPLQAQSLPSNPFIFDQTNQETSVQTPPVEVFEHPNETVSPRRRFGAFIAAHRLEFIIIVVSVLIAGAGTAFGLANMHKYSGNTLASNTDSSEATSSGDRASADSTGDSEDEDTADGSSDDEDMGDTSSEDEDTGDSADSTSDDEDMGDTSSDDEGDDEGDSGSVPEDDGSDDTVNPAPTPIPSTPASSTPHKFTIASWNVKTDNTKTVGTEVLDFLTKSQIIGLQTLRTKAMRDSVKSKVICSSCAYSGYLPAYSGSESGQSDLPIIWNKSAFSMADSGSFRKMCDAASSKTYSYAARYATWVKLQSKVNNKQFYVIDTHTMGIGESGGKPGSDSLLISRFQTHMTNLKSLINELKPANIPIYIVGTFNVDYRYDRFGYTSYFPYTFFKSVSVRSNWDLMGLSGISSGTGTISGSSRIVDYIFTLQRSDVTANSIAISTSTHGSDHYAAYFTNTIK